MLAHHVRNPFNRRDAKDFTDNNVDEELLTRRRLGSTNLAVKPRQVGTSNATQPEHLGPFEYVHLRAPLPKNLKGSEIFKTGAGQAAPASYFLMVCPRP